MEIYTDKCYLCSADQIHCRNGSPGEVYRLIFKPGLKRPLPARGGKIEDCSKFQTYQLIHAIGRERLVLDHITA